MPLGHFHLLWKVSIDTYNTYKTFQTHFLFPIPVTSPYSYCRKSASHHLTTQPPSYPNRKLWRHSRFLLFPHPIPARVNQHQVSCIFTQHSSNFPKFSITTPNGLVYVHHPLHHWKILFSLYPWINHWATKKFRGDYYSENSNLSVLLMALSDCCLPKEPIMRPSLSTFPL